MYNSIADIFNSSQAVFNDPLYEIHHPVQPCNYPPETEEYEEFMNDLNINVYPIPEVGVVHCRIDPLHGSLKPRKLSYN